VQRRKAFITCFALASPSLRRAAIFFTSSLVHRDALVVVAPMDRFSVRGRCPSLSPPWFSFFIPSRVVPVEESA
jgi:hypothetical protein